MKKFIHSAAFLSFVATGSMASAQGVLNNAANQVGNTVSRTAGQTQNIAREAADGFRNQVDDAAASSSIQSNGIANSRANRNGNLHWDQGIRANVGQNVTVKGQPYHQSIGTNPSVGYQDHNVYKNHGYMHNGHGQTVHRFRGSHVGVPHRAGTTHHHHSVNRYGTTSQDVYTLRHDASGREYICVAGQRIYFHGETKTDAIDSQERYQAGYGNAGQDTTAPRRDAALDNDHHDQDEANVVGESRANVESNVDAGLTPEADASVKDSGASKEVNSNLNRAAGDTNVETGVDAAAALKSAIK
ncbi:MAG: hypothetical protein ACF8AM_19530 [Rhodopirellula sp. JB055]|uniref:hypothetical protein n=1 Tax=Rhodopirellula sp. JB055 TaxID=3342846 RepID=UPI00370A96E6